jgi:hypothetical protein
LEAARNYLTSKSKEINESQKETIPPLIQETTKFSSRIIFKPVVSKELKEVGYVIARDDNFLTIMQDQNQRKIPWSSVEGYDGSQVILKITEQETWKRIVRPP